MKSKVQTAPKQLLRRGLDDGTERLRGQLRDASQRGQRDGYGGDQIEDAAWSGTRWGTRGIEKLLKAKRDGRKRTPEAEPFSDADIPEGEYPEPAPAGPSAPESKTDRVRIKTREAVSEFPEVRPSASGQHVKWPESEPVEQPVPESSTERVRIKTREAVSESSEVHPSAKKQVKEPSSKVRTAPDASAQSHTDTPKIKTREALQREVPHDSGDTIPSGGERSAVGDFAPQIRSQETPAVPQHSRAKLIRQRENTHPPAPREKIPSPLIEDVESPRQSRLDIKTKDSYILRQAPDTPEKASRVPDIGSRTRAWYLQRRRSAKEISQAFSQESGSKDAPVFRQTEELPQVPDQVSGRTVERPTANRRQGEREFMQERGRQEAMRKEKLRLSKKDRVSPPQISGSGAPASQARDGTVSYDQQSPMTPSAQSQNAFIQAGDKTGKATAREAKNSVSNGKNTVKTANAGIKSSRHPRQRTVKTAEHSAKAAQKAKAVAKARQRTVEAARATAKAGATTVKGVSKAAMSALKKAIAAARELASAIMAGGWVVAVITLIICIVGLLVTSPFGLFFSDPGSGMTIPEAVAHLNGEFTSQIEQIKTDNPYDTLDFDEAGITLVTDNWINVLAVYSVRVSSGDGTGASVLTDENLAVLRETFWDMNQITYSTETVEHEDEDDETILHISITVKTAEQIAVEYGFTEEQNQLLEEMLKPEYRDLFQSLIGSGPGLTLTDQEIQEILSDLPGALSEERRQVVLTAYQLLGKVHYFWGGKSLVLGWDSRWETPKQVWAAGSPSTGTVRPFGLDCSGFVDWVFYNVSGGTYVIGHGGGAHMQHTYCTPITWAQAQPGDLVFYPNDTHVGIVCGFDSGGNVQIIHCASGSNNVVITGKIGFKTIARPKYYS